LLTAAGTFLPTLRAMQIPMPSGSCGRSSTRASIAWYRWASTVQRALKRLSITIIASESQGLENRVIDGSATERREGMIKRRPAREHY
jgi:hypothetical protein